MRNICISYIGYIIFVYRISDCISWFRSLVIASNIIIAILYIKIKVYLHLYVPVPLYSVKLYKQEKMGHTNSFKIKKNLRRH